MEKKKPLGHISHSNSNVWKVSSIKLHHVNTNAIQHKACFKDSNIVHPKEMQEILTHVRTR